MQSCLSPVIALSRLKCLQTAKGSYRLLLYLNTLKKVEFSLTSLQVGINLPAIGVPLQRPSLLLQLQDLGSLSQQKPILPIWQGIATGLQHRATTRSAEREGPEIPRVSCLFRTPPPTSVSPIWLSCLGRRRPSEILTCLRMRAWPLTSLPLWASSGLPYLDPFCLRPGR